MNTKEFNRLFVDGKIRTVKESMRMYYAVTTTGEVYSVDKKDLTIHQLKPYIDKAGYSRVLIKNKHYSIHRLMAEAFIPNPDNKPEINHIDGTKRNHIDNLVWSTRKENMKHAWNSGLMENARHSNKVRMKDKKVLVTDNIRNNMREVSNKYRRKFSDDEVREMRKLHATGQCSQKDLATKYKVNKATINLIIHRKRYSDVD